MTDTLVSIITPCYNGEKYIPQTIRSVLAQTWENWEMIIVDDGSSDSSAQIIRSFAEADSRIRLLQQENAGSAAARNAGIRAARGRYLALLDADDLWEPEFLQRQLEFMAKHNALCVCCAYRCIDEEGKEVHPPVIPKEVITVKDMLVRNHIGCLSGLYDMRRYGKVFLDESLKSIRDDYAFWLTIVQKEGIAYGNPQCLARYRVFENSTTGNKRKLIAKQYDFYRNYLKLGLAKSAVNLLRWGMWGLKKYKRL